MLERSILVGIAGASASGKSLLAQSLSLSLPSEQLCVISEDAYYKDQSHLSMSERIKTNYDHPDAIDHELMLSHMNQLKAGQTVDIPIYDFTQHNRSEKTKTIAPSRVIIIEGILLLAHVAVRKAFDLRFYMDTPLDICLIRRIQRDTITRGRSVESVIDQYLNTVRPMFLQFIEPSRQHADLIIPRGGKNQIAIDLLKTKIQSFL